jgi:potassium/hydrogen antiporter
MNFDIENILLIGSVLLFISIFASKTIGRLGVPSLLLFLAIGMLAGSEGLGKIHFDNYHIAQSIGVVALVFILFSGGLDTRWKSVKPIIWQGFSLSTLGVFFTAISIGLFSSWLLNISLIEGLLLGSIVSSTDASAVFSILRTKNVSLKGHLRPLLEFESGSNDPMAFFLTISFTFLIVNPETPIINLIPMFAQQMIVGAVAGLFMGKVMVYVINRIGLEYEGLYWVLTLALVAFTYSATSFINGNGFLAVYLAALVLGNNNFIHKKSLIKFYDGQSWLFQIIMFLTLGLLVFPSQVIPYVGTGIVISLFIILLGRPISVFLSLFFGQISFKEKVLVSWVGLRGAVPIVFATYPLIAGVEQSGMFFNIVFFIVLTSVIIQGATINLSAKLLKLDEPEKATLRYPLEIEINENARKELTELDIIPNASSIGRAIVDLNFPKSALIVFINRNDHYFTPHGATVIKENDKLFVMAEDKNEVELVKECLGLKEKTSKEIEASGIAKTFFKGD